MKILPAVLSESLEDYQKAIKLFESFPGNDSIHFDSMDGEFVSSKSCNIEDIIKLNTSLDRSLHLMVKKPQQFFELCNEFKLNEVAFHFRSEFSEYETLSEYENVNFWLVLNPDVPVSETSEVLKYFEGVLLMSVVPGKQGGEFIPEVLEKVTELRSAGFRKKIILDGSVNMNTIEYIKGYDVDELVVGSAIVKQSDPVKAYLALQDKLNN